MSDALPSPTALAHVEEVERAPSGQLTLPEFEALRADIPGGILAILTHAEQLFLCELIRDPRLNRAKAARRAGFPVNGAKQRAYDIMQRPGMQAALDAVIAARRARLEHDGDRMVREVDAVALADITHYQLDDDGNVRLTPDAPPDATRAISQIKRTVRTLKDGSREVTTELKLHGKVEALKLALGVRGMATQRHEVTGADGAPLLPPTAIQIVLVQPEAA